MRSQPPTVVTDPAGVARAWNPDALDTPTATVLSGPADGTTDTIAQLTFSASSPRVTFTCSLDGAPAAPCASPASYTGLAAGPHTFQVSPTDAFGNRGPAAAWSWSIAG